MALSNKNRARGLKRSQVLLDASSTATSYAVGVVGPDPRQTRMYIAFGALAVVVVLLLTIHVFVVPGVLLVVAIYWSINKPVSIVATSAGFTIFHRSQFNGLPRKIWTQLTTEDMNAPSVHRDGTYMVVPSQRLWMTVAEFEMIVASSAPHQGAM